MTEKELAAVMKGIAPVVREYVTKATDPLQARLVALDAHVQALKAAAYLKDAGDWRHGSTYAVGDVTRHSGGLWTCVRSHTATGPTVDHDCWKLWVKRATREAHAVR